MDWISHVDIHIMAGSNNIFGKLPWKMSGKILDFVSYCKTFIIIIIIIIIIYSFERFPYQR